MLAKARAKYGKLMYPGKTKSTGGNVSEVSAGTMDAWSQILKETREQLTRISYETWIEPCKVQKVTHNKIVLSVENELYKEMLERRYLVLEQKVAERVLGKGIRIKVITFR